MSRLSMQWFGVLAVFGALSQPAAAQQTLARTRTPGLLLGFGLEGNVVSTRPGATSTVNQHVGGRGVTLGVGITRNWSAYANVGWTGFLTSGGNRTGTQSLDLGMRYHLPVVAHVVVPFVQGGVSSRALSLDAVSPRTGRTETVMSWQRMAALGGGANIHLTPGMAVSGMSTWSATSHGIASPRLHLGLSFVLGPLRR